MPSPGFFARNLGPRAEIIEGLVREGQIVAFGGAFGVGKSPVLAHLTICLLNGTAWCGRKVARRPVIHFDFESSGATYKRNLLNVVHRLGVAEPQVPDELDVYLQNDHANEPGTAKLLQALGQRNFDARLALLEDALKPKPDAVVIIDPVELLFRIDTREKSHVLALFSEFRRLLSDRPEAAIVLTFNLRKKDRSGHRAGLLDQPREWLEEVCGSLDLMNRSDIRLGMDFLDDEIRVINGVRRGEDMHPLLIRPVGDSPDTLAGFEAVPADGMSLLAAFTSRQMEYWRKLPPGFRFNDAADTLVPRASLSRLLARARSLGVIEESAGVYRKRAV